MTLLHKLLIPSFCFILCTTANAQMQVDYLSFKGFSSLGFGGFFNFSVQVSRPIYFTGEAGVDIFSTMSDYAVIAPVLLGFRYTPDGSGSGLYLEPNAGYCFSGTNFHTVDYAGFNTGQKISGFSTGIGFGWLFLPPGKTQFNVGLRYEHIFSDPGSDIYSLKISHAFIIGNRK